MDSSSVLLDNTQVKLRIGEVIENSVSIIEKGTGNIFKELNKMREEYSGIINKFLDFCEKEGINLDMASESNSRSLSNEKEITNISGNFKSQNFNNVLGKQVKIPSFEYKKFKLENKSLSNNNIPVFNMNSGGYTPVKTNNHLYMNNMGDNSPFMSIKNLNNNSNNNSNNFSRVKNTNNSSHNNNRSKTPPNNLTQLNAAGTHFSTPNESSNNLREVATLKALPKIEQKTSSSIMSNLSSGTKIRNLKPGSNLNNFNLTPNMSKNRIGTPNNKSKNELMKNFILNHNNNVNNYTKKFIKKQSIENLNNISYHNQSRKKSKSGSKERVVTMPNKENSIIISNTISNRDNNSNLNINVKNVNISVNNTNSNTNSNTNQNLLNINQNLLNIGSSNLRRFDDRKLSILDIEGGMPLIPNIEINNSGNNFTSNVSHTFNSNLNTSNIQIDKNQIVKKSEFNKNLMKNTLIEKYEKLFYIMARSDVMPLKLRISFSKLNKKIYNEYPPKEIVKDFSCLLNEKIQDTEKYLKYYHSIPEFDKVLKKSFAPSKTAQNGLNFITKDDEYNLTKEDFKNSEASEEIVNIFKVIFILLKQNYEKLDDKILPDHLINKIMIKMKISNLKSLFLNVICHNLLLTSEQYTKLVALVESNKNILNPPLILKANKVVAYVTFILKEIYEYVNSKAHDGTLILNIKKYKQELKRMKEKASKINHVMTQC